MEQGAGIVLSVATSVHKQYYKWQFWKHRTSSSYHLTIPDNSPIVDAMLSGSNAYTTGKPQTFSFFDLFDFPELKDSYPDAKNIKVRIGPLRSGEQANYDDKTRTININSTAFENHFKGKTRQEIQGSTNNLQGLRALVAHELAHYVQFREDWNIGGSESLFEHELEPYQKEYDELSAKRETLDPNTAEYEKVNNRLNEISEILHDPALFRHAFR